MKLGKRTRITSAAADKPLGTTLASLDAFRRLPIATPSPVAPCRLPPRAAIGAVVADDVVFAYDRPLMPLARRAGWAVASTDTIGASPYAPVTPAALVAVEPGDAVLPPFDAVAARAGVPRVGGEPRFHEVVAPGTDLLPRGWCARAGSLLAAAGTVVSERLAFLAESAAVAALPVRRPRVAVLHDGSDVGAEAARALVLLLGRGPALVETAAFAAFDPAEADLLLLLGRGDLDAADPARTWFAAAGTIEGGGLALAACEATAWGTVAGSPALLLSGRPEDLFVATLAILEPMIAALAGWTPPIVETTGRLARKLVSEIGLAEIALLARADDGSLVPLSTGRPPWTAIARADAWVELGPECEGFADGSTLAVRALAPIL